ncbi:MAG TPA: LPS export ABC transporter periplasmic protein LptC [Stellaceae bacterium]|nr:LPS export ABC transporter periplasmic protein LptC [Stellaceae bacterium]
MSAPASPAERSSATRLGAIPGRRAAWTPASQAGDGPTNPHSRRVALLKRVLPATGVALLLLIAMWPGLAPLWERIRIAVPAIDLRDARELRMIDPRYAGIDRLGRPFVVTAAVGRQVPDRQDLMSLEAPRAQIKLHSGAELVVTALTGVYQSQTQLLDLFGKVALVHQNGTRFVTDAARVDAAHNTAEGNDPVEGHGPSGNVKAQGFRILDNADIIQFTGRSDLLLKGAASGTQKSTPEQLPASVATIAARTAAAARPALLAAAPQPARHVPAHAARPQAQRPQAKRTARHPARVTRKD